MNVNPRVALIGLGAIGTQHARVLGGMPDVDFVAIYDPRIGPGHLHGVVVVENYHGLLDLKPDYCVVATPTSTHVELVLDLISRGIACLIEKPLAQTAAEAERVALAAAAAGVLVGVGHIERFNPSVIELRARIDAGQVGDILQVATRRHGPYPSRIGDVGVVLDLASHDIHTTLWVTGASYESLDVRRVSLLRPGVEDLVNVVGTLSSGAVVSHAVNWLSPAKERTFSVLGDRGMLVADTLVGDLTFYENGVAPLEWAQLRSLRGPSEGNITRYAIRKVEPLLAEHTGFLRAFVDGDTTGIVTPRQAAEVISVAERMLA